MMARNMPPQPDIEMDAARALSDPAELRATLSEHGVAVLRSLVPRSLLESVREVAVAFARETGWVEGLDGDDLLAVPGATLSGTGYDDPRWVKLQQEVFPRPEFRAIAEHPAVRALISAAFDGAPFRDQQGDICRLLLPGEPDLATLPHQDRHYIPGDAPLWTVWFPLVDCRPWVGSLMVWPGSQRLGLLPHRGEGSGRQGVDPPASIEPLTLQLEPGDAVIFGHLTVHGSASNQTARHARLSIDFRFALGDG